MAIEESKRVGVAWFHVVPYGFFVCLFKDIDHKWIFWKTRFIKIPRTFKLFQGLGSLLQHNRFIRWGINKINTWFHKTNEKKIGG
jgi:hypothetical protein